MTALESSVKLFRSICEIIENKIESHFKKVDESVTSDAESGALRISAVTTEIISQLNLKESEALYSMSLYLRSRPDLEIRSGKNGGIWRVGVESSTGPMSPKECAQKHYDMVKSLAPSIIDEAFKIADEAARAQGVPLNKVRINCNDLGDKLAEKLDVKGYVTYHCLRRYISEERNKDLFIALGRQGGLMRRFDV